MSIPGSANPLLLASAAAPTGYEVERSLRFNSADSAYLSRTPASSGNRKTWTWAGWARISDLSASFRQLFTAADNNYAQNGFDDLGRLRHYPLNNGNAAIRTVALFRDPSAWYHIVFYTDTTDAVQADRLRIYVNGVRQAVTGTFPSQNLDLAFNQAIAHNIGRYHTGSEYFSGYLADIHFIDGQALDPTSFGFFDANGIWQPKAYTGTYGTNGFHLPFSDNSTAAALGTDTSGNGNDWAVNNISIVDQSLSVTDYSNVTDLYIGGVSSTINSQNLNTLVRSAIFQNRLRDTTDQFTLSGTVGSRITISYSGLTSITGIAIRAQRVSFIDANFSLSGTITGGRTVSSSSTEFIFNTTATSGSFTITTTNSSNGLVIQDIAYLGATYYGESSNDSLVDSPTNGTQTDTGVGGEVVGNYATLNPLAPMTTATVENGNLVLRGNAGGYDSCVGTIGVASGQWYWEVVNNLPGTNIRAWAGINDPKALTAGATTASAPFPMYAVGTLNYGYDGTLRLDGSVLATYATYTFGDIIGVALDMDSRTIEYYVNGSSVFSYDFSSASSLGDIVLPSISTLGGSTYGETVTVNFGQRPFAFSAPSGYKALNTANLPAPVVTTSGSYTGNGVADGPFVYLNGVPTAMTIGGNSVTFGTDADKLSNGFKIRTTSTTYNQNASTYNYTITSTGAPFKTARAQPNP